MLVLRKDISEKVKNINLLVINMRIFDSKSLNYDYGDIWPTKYNDIATSLGELGVRVIGYKHERKSPVKLAGSLGIELVELNGKRKIDILTNFKGKHSFRDMVFIGGEIEDLELIRLSRFSVTPVDSPLEVKMESHYVSNFSGLKAFEEIGNLIINAKRVNSHN